MGKEIEKRFIHEIRAKQNDEGKLVVVGTPIVYNAVTKLWEDVEEIIMPGAAADSIASDDVRAVWNHNTDIVLGRTKNATLKLVDGADGVACEIEFPDSEEGRSKFASVQRGDVDGMSFGFTPIDETWTARKEDSNDIWTRTITRLKVWEVSPCTFPQYDETEISARSKELALRNRPEPETSGNGNSAEDEGEQEKIKTENIRMRQDLHERVYGGNV